MIHGVKPGMEALYAAQHWRDAQTYLLVLPDDRALQTAECGFDLFTPDIERLSLPAWDCLPYDRLSPKTDIMTQRRRVAAQLQSKPRAPRVVLCTPSSLLQRLPVGALASLTLAKNGSADLNKLADKLSALGFARTLTVREPGEFAIRGDILDLFPPHNDEPVRVSFFGDAIESIDAFNPLSQMRTTPVDAVDLSQTGEVMLTPESIARFREGYRTAFAQDATLDPIYASISEGRPYAGMEHYLPLFTDELATPAAMANAVYFADGAQAAFLERRNYIADLYQARLGFLQVQKDAKKQLRSVLVRPLAPDALYLSDSEAENLNEHTNAFSAFAHPDQTPRRLPDFTLVRQDSVHDAVRLAAVTFRDAQREGIRTLYAAGASGLDRMREMLAEFEFAPSEIVETDDPGALKRSQLGLVAWPLEHGFWTDDVLVLTEGDVFGDRLSAKPVKRRASDTFFKEFASLQPGDLVVHRDHGIGRFDGLEAVTAGGAAHDCLRIVYDAGDRLFVPVEAMDVLSRYGEDEGVVALDKLGSGSWQARKARVKKNVLEIADKLLAIAAQRQLREATVFEPHGVGWQEFCARFPYAETEDQLRAIEDVAHDLKKGRPMDRLVCGDVGFGKTEVALRAAFIVAQNGEQVAVTVPTTLLARQHFENFSARFAGFGIRVAELSRLSTPKENAEIKEGLKTSEIQIVIGTHALLSESIKFSRLGLVVVDEEQRFGVKQKERLKDLQKDVHVLTLTATPIPRTLQMALTGVRDLSIIASAPVDRLSVRTFVAPFDPVMLREALMRERYRGGQSFIVSHYISSLEDLEKRLQQMVPELSYIVAHGQMPSAMLEERMTAYVEGKYDILLSTAIIESGIDIPRANTMIIYKPEQFGLAQLYQLRGRIGRSKQRGYAYLAFEGDTALTERAQKRLHVLESLDQLGGGFQLASHDMDIRGAGNLLGDQQSGHIKEVGIELYQQMLEDAVQTARAGGTVIETTSDWTPVINLGLPVLIPEVYVPDLSVRIALYRRLADLKSDAEIDIFADELVDRFGKMPDEVRTLLDTMRIKALCFAAQIEKIDAGPKGILITFRNNAPADPGRVLEVVAGMGGLAKLRPDQKVQLSGAFETRGPRVQAIARFLERLVLPQNRSKLSA